MRFRRAQSSRRRLAPVHKREHRTRRLSIASNMSRVSTDFATASIASRSSPRPSSRRSRRALQARRVTSSSAATTSAADGVGFSAAGFFFPYHVGVWEELIDIGVMRSEETPCAGASAGSLVAALHACGMSPEDGKRILSDVLADCRKNGVIGRVGGVLERILRKELPSDAHERCSRGNLFISVSSPSVNFGSKEGATFSLEGEIISEFESFDDLIGALLASCHIPLYCGWPARRYRGKWCVDGGWHSLTPTPQASGCIRVCAFPLLDAWHKAEPGDGKETGDFFAQQASFWSDWGHDNTAGLLIAPDAAGGEPSWDYSEAIRYALLPGSNEILEEMVVMGRMDAKRWAQATGRASSSNRESLEIV